MSNRPITDIAIINPPLTRTPKPGELISFVSMSGISEGGGITESSDLPFSEVNSGFTRFQNGDVLFAKITPCMENGKGALAANLTGGVGCGSTEFHVLRTTQAGIPAYLYQLMQWKVTRQTAEIFMSGSAGQQRVQSDFFRRHKVYAPALPIQQKIAAILTATDTAIEKTEALIGKYQQIKAGLMHDLFTRGVLPNGQLRPPRSEAPELYQETAIGWIPREWAFERLGVILAKSGGYLQTGPFGSQLHAAEYQDEGVPVVMPQDINDGLIETATIARITEARAISLARHRLKIGDIIIARRGELSRAAAIGNTEINWICGTGCFLLRLGRTELNHFFFSHVYRYDYIQRQVAGMQVGTTMPSLNNSVMSRLFFPLPNPVEQNEITRRLDLAEKEIEALANHSEKLRAQKLGLMQDLLTGKVAVQVDEPDTEVMA